jgi:uncharacterized membrane protein
MDQKLTKPVNEIDSIEELAALRHSINVNQIHKDELSLGDRISDRMADVAGSWAFIISFLSVLAIWIVINAIQLLKQPFDPFPFILLNLVLSCVAAIQAPVIMMSQNRQEKKDRIRAEQDYQINLKAEILVEDIIMRLKKLEEAEEIGLANQEAILKALAELKKDRSVNS